MSKAAASSPCALPRPSIKTRSRAKDAMIIAPSNIYSKDNHIGCITWSHNNNVYYHTTISKENPKCSCIVGRICEGTKKLKTFLKFTCYFTRSFTPHPPPPTTLTNRPRQWLIPGTIFWETFIILLTNILYSETFACNATHIIFCGNSGRFGKWLNEHIVNFPEIR